MTRTFTNTLALLAAVLLSATMLAETTRLPAASAHPAPLATPLVF